MQNHELEELPQTWSPHNTTFRTNGGRENYLTYPLRIKYKKTKYVVYNYSEHYDFIQNAIKR